jgi:hypothetical protein
VKQSPAIPVFALLAMALVAPVRAMADGGVRPQACDTTHDHDIGVLNFRLWDTCHVEDTIWFQPVVKNLGRFTEFVVVGYGLYADDSTLVYSGSAVLMMSPGDSDSLDVPFPRFRTFTLPGTYIVFSCTASCDSDRNPANNGGKKRAVVLPSQAVEEDPMASLSSESGWAPLSRLMRAAEFTELILDPKLRLQVFDPTGRRVEPAKVNRGIYFVNVRGPSAAAERRESRKLILTR